MINFSNQTRMSGWCSYSEIDHFKRAMFNYMGSNTTLDPKAIAHLRETRRDNCIVFMLSDTGFSSQENAKQVLAEMEKTVSSGGVGMYLFQLGGNNDFSNEAHKLGVTVHPVQSVEDFMGKTIMFTKDLYGEAVK
jgi:arylsulfatase A-like enzyme